MDIALKYKIVEKIVQSNDENLLAEINSLIDHSGKDFWDELPESIKQSIEIAKTQLDEGKGRPHAEVMRDLKSDS